MSDEMSSKCVVKGVWAVTILTSLKLAVRRKGIDHRSMTVNHGDGKVARVREGNK